MNYITPNVSNTLTLNVNNNSRDTFVSYTLEFTHILSQYVKTFVIDTTDNTEYGSNDRYCEFVFSNDLLYEGEYQLKIYGNGSILVYTGIVINGELIETFIQYESDNENNENYIYIE